MEAPTAKQPQPPSLDTSKGRAGFIAAFAIAIMALAATIIILARSLENSDKNVREMYNNGALPEFQPGDRGPSEKDTETEATEADDEEAAE